MTGGVAPHLVIDGFLGDGNRKRLLDWTLSNEERFAPALLTGGVHAPKVRQASILRDLGPLSSMFEAQLRARYPGWITALRSTAFDACDVELELAAHNQGARFLRHIDTRTGELGARGDRMLSTVYYFHQEPRRFSGGALRLHRIDAGDAGVDLTPEQDRLVVFPAWAPHEVTEVSCPSGRFADSRFAVNGWLYRAPRAMLTGADSD